MSTEGFTRALKRVLVYEGGKVDNPKDPGGRTNQGVTRAVYDAYRKRMNRPKRDVYQMEPAERDAIYRAQYWNAVRADELPAGVDFVVFDGAVNSGPTQSVKWLQRALGPDLYDGQIDGQIGLRTISAVKAHPDHDALVAEIGDRRLAFLKSLRSWRVFGKGWRGRVENVTDAGQAWASGSVPAKAAQYFYGGETKALLADASPAPGKAVADAATGAGSSTVVLSQITDQLLPLSYQSEAIGRIVLYLTIAGVAIAVGGTMWSYFAKLRNEHRQSALDLTGAA